MTTLDEFRGEMCEALEHLQGNRTANAKDLVDEVAQAEAKLVYLLDDRGATGWASERLDELTDESANRIKELEDELETAQTQIAELKDELADLAQELDQS